MADLPQYEARPTVGYEVGQWLSRTCYTRSIPINLLRLAALWWTLPQLVLWLGERGSGWVCAASVAVLIGSFCLRPKARTPKARTGTRWTKEERRLREAVRQATSTGTSITEAIRSVTDEPLAIDYGTIAGTRQPVLVAPDLRRAHQLITGGSGTGKSKFIATQAAQDALTSSLFAVDPHEELVQDILRISAPILRERGTILLWPDGPQKSLYPWNPLTTGPARAPWQAADAVVGAVKRVWGLSDQNTFIIDVLKHTTWALAASGWTLLEAQRFLTSPAFRAYVTAQANVPQITAWVQQFDTRPHKEQIELTTSTLVRLARLNANPHLQRMIGCGVTDARYVAARRRAGLPVIEGVDLGQHINAGHHVLIVIPQRIFGEDQYLMAGLAQSVMLEAIFRRRPNDPAMPELSAYLDEAAAYATDAGLGKLLAQARKYKFSATVAVQGLHQAEPNLAEQLRTNTAIKAVFATDNPDEARASALMLYGYQPLAVKQDTRQRVEGREIGQFQTYSPLEQQAFHASRVMQLPQRHYILKVRGEGSPEVIFTPDYSGPFELVAATQRATMQQVAPLVNPATVDAELAWRWQWLEDTFTPREGGEGDRITIVRTPPPDDPSRGHTATEEPSPDDLISLGS
ncbi:MAG TPA: TraM recognition domain-containing protein [Herpetosiphonaceae bacterium]